MQPPAESNNKPTACCASEKRIVLVGASVRSAAQSAGRAGFCVTGIDLFGDTDTQKACHRHFRFQQEGDLEHIVQACAGVPVIRVGGLGSHDLLFRRLAEVSETIGPPQWVCDQLRDLTRLRKLAASAGMRFPATFDHSKSVGDVSREANGQWLRKQRDSCGGLGVRWHSEQQQVTPQEYLQKWIPGRSYGATLISDAVQARLLGVCRSLFTRHPSRPFVYAGSMGPVEVSPAVARSLCRLGRHVVATTKLRGLLNVDFLIDRSGAAWLLEINPRWSGSSELIERRLMDQHPSNSKESLFGRWIDALGKGTPSVKGEPDMLFDRSATTSNRSSMHLKRVVFARVGMRFDRCKFSELIGNNQSLHDVPRDGTIIAQGDPVCTVITSIEPSVIDPMGRHRSALREIHAAIKRCAQSSPRSSAYE